MSAWPPIARAVAAGLLAMLVLTSLGCAGRRSWPRDRSTTARSTIAIYKSRITNEDGRSRRFRLLLYAAPPDRLHGEVVAPIGGTELIIDGHDERLAVSIVRERLAFVGKPAPDVMRRVIGVALTPGQLIRALTSGEIGTDADLRVERSGPSGPGGLPESFRVRGGGRELSFQLKRFDLLRAPEGALAAGVPPPGFEVQPLDTLRWEWFEEAEAEDPAVDTPRE